MVWVGPKGNYQCPCKRGKMRLDMQKKEWQCDHMGTDWSDVATRSWKRQEQSLRWSLQREHSPWSPLISVQ